MLAQLGNNPLGSHRGKLWCSSLWWHKCSSATVKLQLAEPFLGKHEAWRIISQEGWEGFIWGKSRWDLSELSARNSRRNCRWTPEQRPERGSDAWEPRWSHQRLGKQSRNSPGGLRALCTPSCTWAFLFQVNFASSSHGSLPCSAARSSCSSHTKLSTEVRPPQHFTPQELAQTPRDGILSPELCNLQISPPALPPCPEQTQLLRSEKFTFHLKSLWIAGFDTWCPKFLPLREWGLNSKSCTYYSLKISSFCTNFLPYTSAVAHKKLLSSECNRKSNTLMKLGRMRVTAQIYH